MSWLSEWLRKITKTPKIPAEVLAQKIVCRSLVVLGEKGRIDLTCGAGGARVLLRAEDESLVSAVSLFRKATGEINLDVLNAQGSVQAGLDVAPDGTQLFRFTHQGQVYSLDLALVVSLLTQSP